jgi:hypothetical protein
MHQQTFPGSSRMSYPLQCQTLIMKAWIGTVLFIVCFCFHLQLKRAEESIISQPIVETHKNERFAKSRSLLDKGIAI